MIEEHGDTKVKPIPQEAGENNVKSVTYKSQGHVKFPNFNDKRYGIKSLRIEQPFPQKEQEPSIWSRVVRALPLIGYLTTSKKIEAKNNPDKHTKEAGSKLEKGKVEQVGDKKRVK